MKTKNHRSEYLVLRRMNKNTKQKHIVGQKPTRVSTFNRNTRVNLCLCLCMFFNAVCLCKQCDSLKLHSALCRKKYSDILSYSNTTAEKYLVTSKTPAFKLYIKHSSCRMDHFRIIFITLLYNYQCFAVYKPAK